MFHYRYVYCGCQFLKRERILPSYDWHVESFIIIDLCPSELLSVIPRPCVCL